MVKLEYKEGPHGLLYPTLPAIPNLTKYGLMRWNYLQEAQPWLFIELLLNGSIWQHCYDIQKIAQTRLDLMISQMAKTEGVTEELKQQNWLKWVGAMNNIRDRAEEIILAELIYI